MKLKPEYYDKYKEVHAAVWPEVLRQIKACNIVDCRFPPPMRPPAPGPCWEAVPGPANPGHPGAEATPANPWLLAHASSDRNGQ